jgi:CBS domain-containing protein
MFRHFKDLEKLANALHVEHFATMDDELEYVDSQDPAVEVLARMEGNDFDVIPVKKDGKKSFFVTKKDLKYLSEGEIIANYMKPIDSSEFVGKAISIKDALKELGKRGWFFVGAGDLLEGIVTRSDISKPAVSFYLLSHLLMLESGLRRLLGSYTNIQIPDAAPEHGDSFPKVINGVFKAKVLLADIKLPLTGTPYKKETKCLIDLRNALAHGRNITDLYRDETSKVIDLSGAIECISKLDSLLERVASKINNRDDVWEKFIETQIVKQVKTKEIDEFINIREIWSGNNAMPDLPMNFPIYVISAYNPLEEVLPTDENEKRHLCLHKILESRKLRFEEVFGESPYGNWSEASFAIEGMSKENACELAEKFGQRAIFELTQDEIKVISVDGKCRGNKSRCR